MEASGFRVGQHRRRRVLVVALRVVGLVVAETHLVGQGVADGAADLVGDADGQAAEDDLTDTDGDVLDGIHGGFRGGQTEDVGRRIGVHDNYLSCGTIEGQGAV